MAEAGSHNRALQVCLATDAGYAPRVEVALYSLLQHASCPVHATVLITDDAVGRFPRLDAVLARHPDARVEYVVPDFLRDGARGHAHSMSVVSFARMLIPQMMTGRVLYLDADILVTGDLAPARDMDLGGQPVAAALDVGVERIARWMDPTAPRPLSLSAKRKARAAQHLALMNSQGIGAAGYFNAGVLILDCDAIRAVPGLADAMLDLDRAQGYWAFDQDLLNALFRGRTHILAPEWNVWNAIARTKHAPFTPQDRARYAQAREAPLIVHYLSSPKPWSKPSIAHLTRGFGWHRAYWRAEAALDRLVAQTS